jgi:U3 small nucleolar RNA-associated protein 10
MLSGYFQTPAATKCLEYMIRRFKIHVFNVEAAMTSALPYHSTTEFVKLVQLANLEGTSFYWLAGVKENGAAPPRDQLVKRCARDGAFLSFACEAAATSASVKVRHSGFWFP